MKQCIITTTISSYSKHCIDFLLFGFTFLVSHIDKESVPT